MSKYGPKKYELYNETLNLNRKVTRTGEEYSDLGSNKFARSYSTKPGQLTAHEQAELMHQKSFELNGPVKIYTVEEVEKFRQEYNKRKNK